MIFTEAQRDGLRALSEKRFKDERQHGGGKAPSGAVLKKKFKVAQQALGDLEGALRGAGRTAEAGDIEHLTGMVQGVAKLVRESVERLSEGRAVDDYPWKFWPQYLHQGKKIEMDKLRVGHLGKVSYHAAKMHEKAGIMKHKWMHHATYGGRRGGIETHMKCMICGVTKEVDEKGRQVYR